MINDSLEVIFNSIDSLDKTKKVRIKKAINEILAKDILALKNLPSFDNAALDGYAFNYADRENRLKILGTIFAGDKRIYKLGKNEAYRIMTGAMMPQNSDTIVQIEKAVLEDDSLIIDSSIKQYNAYRYAGEEVKKGEILLKKGELLTPAKIMFLASQGISEIEVCKKPKIASFSSGDEIIEPWQKASEYEIYNANSSGIEAVLKSNNFKSKYQGIIKDSYEETLLSLKKAAKFDVIITSGGASKGDKDFMKKCLHELGYTEILNHINVRPGKPTGVYKKDKKIVFILPGNPMAAYLMAYLIVVPILKKLSGQNELNFRKITAEFDGDIKLKSQRSNLVLGIYENGKFKTINNNKFGSGMIKPLVLANAVYVSKIDESELKNTQLLEIIMLYWQ